MKGKSTTWVTTVHPTADEKTPYPIFGQAVGAAESAADPIQLAGIIDEVVEAEIGD